MTKIGTDPEFMLEKDGKIYSAIPILNKKKKINYSSFYHDNVLAECTIKPSSNKEEFLNNIKESLYNFSKLVHPYKLISKSAHYYDKSELFSEKSFEISCDAEKCVYDLKVIHQDEQILRSTNLRTAGGHIHIGDKILKDKYKALSCVKMMDLFVGFTSIYLDKNKDAVVRKKLFGKAGRFRDKNYGIEYRSISNFWLNNPYYAAFIFDLSCFVVDFIKSNKDEELWSVDISKIENPNSWHDLSFNEKDCYQCKGYDLPLLIECINNHQKCKKIYNFIKKLIPANLFDRYENLINNKFSDDLMYNWNIY